MIWDSHASIELKSDPGVPIAYSRIILFIGFTNFLFVFSFSSHKQFGKVDFYSKLTLLSALILMCLSFFENELENWTLIGATSLVLISLSLQFIGMLIQTFRSNYDFFASSEAAKKGILILAFGLLPVIC